MRRSLAVIAVALIVAGASSAATSEPIIQAPANEFVHFASTSIYCITLAAGRVVCADKAHQATGDYMVAIGRETAQRSKAAILRIGASQSQTVVVSQRYQR